MDELLPFLSPDEQHAVIFRMGPLVEDCLRRHTLGDRTSLRVEEAQAVFSAVCFALRQVPEALSGDLFAAYHQGQELLWEKSHRCRLLWKRVMETLPSVRSNAMLTTVASISTFLDHGDPTLPELSCTIDYPLLKSVPETLLGVDYLHQWLLQLLYENRLMALFSFSQQEAVLRRHCADYEELPVNLCEPVLMTALGHRILRSEAIPALLMDREQRRRLAERLYGRTVQEIQALLLPATDSLAVECIADDGMQAYLRQAAADAAFRIAAADREGIANGVF